MAWLSEELQVLIGPGTFSSAQMNAIDLRDNLGAVLIGQPTGEKLHVQYTTRLFHLAAGSAAALQPAVSKRHTCYALQHDGDEF